MAEKKIDHEFVQEDIWAKNSVPGEINPLGKVPCLILDDGSTMFDSSVIVEFLDTMTPVCKLLVSGGRARANIRCWEALADGVVDAGVLLRVETTMREPAQRSDWWIARQRSKIDAGIASMAHGLGERPFCAGNDYTLADVAVGCALGWIGLRFPEITWREDHDNLARLTDKLARRPSFALTLPAP